MKKIIFYSIFFFLSFGTIYADCVTGDCENGTGEWSYQGGYYNGKFVRGKPSGKGWIVGGFTWYRGVFCNGGPCMTGYNIISGVVTTKFNVPYDGKYKIVFPNGMVIDGDFKNGLLDGKVKYTWDDKNHIKSMEGIFAANKLDPEEDVKIIYRTGRVYSGKLDYRTSVPEGKGTLTYEKNDYKKRKIFTGEFKAGRPVNGKLVYLNGDIYEGDFGYDAEDGRGILKYNNGDIYEGEFASGRPQNKGKLTYKNGKIFVGDFDNGKPRTDYYVYADGGLRLRAEPKTEAPMVTLIPFGTIVKTIELTEKEETISGKTGKWHKITYKDEKNKDNTGWVFGGFLSNQRLLRKCSALDNFNSQVWLGHYPGVNTMAASKTTEPADEKFWIYDPRFQIQYTMFKLNPDGRGLLDFAGLRTDQYKIPVIWKKSGDNIVIEGSSSISREAYLNSCYPVSMGIPEEQIEKCKIQNQDNWNKKFGEKNEINLQYVWTVIYIKAGEVQVVGKRSDDFKFGYSPDLSRTMKCGY